MRSDNRIPLCLETQEVPVLIQSFFKNSYVSGAVALRKMKKMPRA